MLLLAALMVSDYQKMATGSERETHAMNSPEHRGDIATIEVVFSVEMYGEPYRGNGVEKPENGTPS